MRTRTVLKVEAEGTVTSFRYPFFTQGFQPTFEMPPPSTIYGHICSAVGDWIAPESLEFGYYFSHAGKFVDYKEHLHFSSPIQPNPFDRELLFQPRLTLYLARREEARWSLDELAQAFREPHFAVVLGRSQDLMSYRRVRITQLHEAERGYFENTLLPLEMAPALERGVIAATMARYIDPRRRPQWGNYAVLQGRALWPPPASALPDAWDEQESEPQAQGLRFEGMPETVWVDLDSPDHPKHPGVKRAVWFHRFVKEQ